MNIFTAYTTWSALCALSLRMTNGAGEKKFSPELVYLADNSMGGRDVDASSDPVDAVENDFGYWEGFSEEGAQRFLWGSRSSGATIVAVRLDSGSWLLVFEGCDTSARSESTYVRDFALAANLETLEADTLDNTKAIAAVINLDLEWMLEKGRTEDADKLRAFAAKLEISIE